jgi:hypothetical protein
MTSRLRLAVMASHSAEELRAAARTLGRAAREVGFDPAAEWLSGAPRRDDDAGAGEEYAEPAAWPTPAKVFDFEARAA